MKNEQHSDRSIHQKLLALLILTAISAFASPPSAAAQISSPAKPGDAKTVDAGNELAGRDSFAKKFAEGRDLIDRQEWAPAAAAFREAVEKSPDHKLADAALYWLAFCYKKQKKFTESAAALDRLLEKFPASPWSGDAQVMKLEIAPWIGERFEADETNFDDQKKKKSASDLQSKIVKGAADDAGRNKTLADKPGLRPGVPLERADEIRLAAFQSLLAADPKRAVETMGEVLGPGSGASETLKQEILRVWRNPRLFAAQTLVSGIVKNIGVREFASLLRDTLLKSFQSETSQKIRREIIYVLAGLADAQANDFLKKLYAAANEREIKKAIISAFGGSANIFYVFSVPPGQKVDFDAARRQTRKPAFEVLLEIVRTEKDAELRRLAFSNLSRFSDWSTSEQEIEIMAGLYDAETGEEFKLDVIRAFARSQQRRAILKLMEIAENDKSDVLRLEAIYQLRTVKDPQVVKFLEELIKKS